MGVTLSKIANNTADLKVPVGDEFVNVVFYPGKVTEKVFKRLQAFARLTEENLEECFDEFNKMIVKLVKSWDLTEDDEVTIVPLDPDTLADISLGFRMQIVNGILGEIRPNEVATGLTQN